MWLFTKLNEAGHQIKSLYLRYYAEACNEWHVPFPRLSAWATQLRKDVAAEANRYAGADFTDTGFEPQTPAPIASALSIWANGR